MIHKDLPVLTFESQKDWKRWLSQNHASVDRIWVRLFKKSAGQDMLNYDQALEEALCCGWIDGLVNKYDDISYIQRFTPRRKRSTWSRRNQEIVARLIKEGRMQPSGQAEIDRAKEDGRWEAAYASPTNTAAPDDFVKAISKNTKAKEFWEVLNKTNKFAMIWQINNAKREETRIRRIKKFVGMLERGEKLY